MLKSLKGIIKKIMKKLIAVFICFVLSNLTASAIEDLGGSNPAVINRQNQIQLRDLQIEKQYI